MVLVLAFGNPLRGDDGVAWMIADALGRPPGVEIHCRHQLGPELAAAISVAHGVLFIDAAADGEPGEIRTGPVQPGPAPSDLTHALPPAPLMQLAALVYGASPPALLLTVSGREFGYGPGLSPEVRAAVPRATAAAREALDRLRIVEASGVNAPPAPRSSGRARAGP